MTANLDNWHNVPLRDILLEQKVLAGGKEDQNYENAPVLSLTKNYGLILQSDRFDHRVATENVSKYKVVMPEWIVYNPYVLWEGAIHALTGPTCGLVSPAYEVWEVVGADAQYADYLLKSPPLLRAYWGLSSGTVQRRRSISKRNFLDIEVMLPPLTEQRAIAHALRTVQDAKEARRRELELERERKAALMQHLFTHGTRGEPRKQTEIGEMPESWRVVKLGEHTKKPDYGYTTSASHKPSGPKFLRITDIQEEGVNWQTVPYCQLDDTPRTDYYLEPEDIVVARIGATTGKAFLIRDCPPAIFASYLIRLRTQPTLLSGFLSTFFQSPDYWRQIEQNKGGRLKGGVNIPILQSLTLPLPSIEEQQQITDVMEACDARITALSKEVSLLDELFRAMLEELMTGRLSALPVVEPELAGK